MMFNKQGDQIQLMAQNIGRVESTLKALVEYIKEIENRIDGIDSVAFSALLLHEKKTVKLTKKNVEATKKAIGAIGTEMDKYREALVKAEEKKNASKQNNK